MIFFKFAVLIKEEMKKFFTIFMIVFLAVSGFSQIRRVNIAKGSTPTIPIKKEGAKIFIDVIIDSSHSNAITVDYTINTKSDQSGLDVTSTQFQNFIPSVGNISFSPGTDSIRVTFNPILDGILEGNDTFFFIINNIAPSPNALGMDIVTRLIIQDSGASAPPPLPNRPSRTIAEVRGGNTDGIPDSVGKLCKLTGVIYGQNKQTTVGYNFALCDATGCIGIFSTKNFKSGTSTSNLTLAEGDSVTIYGKIEESNGLGQINFEDKVALDTILKLGTRTIKSAVTVTKLDEESESKLVKLTNLSLKTGGWASADTNLIMTNAAGDEFQIRLLNKSNVISSTAKIVSGKKYNVTGIGGQFDKSSGSKTTGYQLIPRKGSDFEEVTSGGGGSSIQVILNSKSILVYPNPVLLASTIISMESAQDESAILTLMDNTGKIVVSTSLKLNTGMNQYKLDHLDRIQNGNYILRIEARHLNESQELLIQH